MDVEKLKKVNNLARTLRQQGIVANQQDASHLAGQIAGNKPEQEITNVNVEDNQKVVISDQDTGEVLVEEPEKEQKQTETNKEQQVDRDTYTKEEVVNVLQKFADQFVSEINKIQTAVEEQNKRIMSMENSVNNISKPTVKEEEKPQTTLNTQQPEQKKEENNPRSGEFESDDVSVEKFFYFGQKNK